ncbi:MAG: hypothetical protein Q9218_008011, partial [Villophora microphyllina]
MVDINYFTCTLGQALNGKGRQALPYTTVPEFLKYQANAAPDRPAVGFPVPVSETQNPRWNHRVYTFAELHKSSLSSAALLGKLLKFENNGQSGKGASKTIALLCPSSIEFLFAWLGLMQLDYSVLLVAPQCQPSAIAHLCKTCDVQCLIYDEAYAELAGKTEEIQDSRFEALAVPKDLMSQINAHATQESPPESLAPKATEGSPSHVAFLFHTSGTSSGLPKPIPQTHHGVIGVLPRLSNGHEKATFTTTPLYHGGISDCFRAWTSGALIWLFPGKDVPITSTNILKCLETARSAEGVVDAAPIRYFSSVPYILQMVVSESEGLKMLQDMDIVGVGGAALPQDAGDELVQNGINLVSRFGSAECGFLLSSHRDYKKDREWQYLRNQCLDLLAFEKQDDELGLSELVIRPSWPHMAKRNRDDGSFATADLLAPHPNIPNAWKYHSRADSQLTLITGKKFDPAPLEAAIASHGFLSDALIFGNGMQQPGALLFRSDAARDMAEESLLNQ